MVECGGFENRCPDSFGTGGSNPPPSARILLDITWQIDQTDIMRISAQVVLVIAIVSLLLGKVLSPPAYAQSDQTSTQNTSQTNNALNYLLPNADADVPVNHHSYTQILLIDGLSSLVCLMTGIDPTNTNQPCLGVDPNTGKVGLAKLPSSQAFGEAQSSQPQIGGAIGFLANSIGTMYTPAVSSSQYISYLEDNFGIVKQTYAAAQGTQLQNCKNTQFGYGFCGLAPIFLLWSDVRDLSYAMLTILFIVIGVGVMLRFRVDPRTVMTLQNQIPRVVVSILLITFSYAIAGIMIDLMWTATYTGINYIASASPVTSYVGCNGTPISQGAEQLLIDQPISFTNTVLENGCNGIVDSGLLQLSNGVSNELGDLVTNTIHDLLFSNSGCHISFWDALFIVPALGDAVKCAVGGVALNVFLWLTELIVKIIILVAILVALFRLWFELIKTYLTFLIFVILGPLWIVLGLIPGRPMGFEKLIRIQFANLAVFVIVAYMIVFARVISDSVSNLNPQNVFIPPLVGNPNIASFKFLMSFGIILLLPTIPNLIKSQLKAKSQNNLGAAVGAMAGVGAAAVTAPGKKVWESLNRRNPTTGEPEGALAVRKQQLWEKTPYFGKRALAAKQARHQIYGSGGGLNYATDFRRLQRENMANIDEHRMTRPERRTAKRAAGQARRRLAGGARAEGTDYRSRKRDQRRFLPGVRGRADRRMDAMRERVGRRTAAVQEGWQRITPGAPIPPHLQQPITEPGGGGKSGRKGSGKGGRKDYQRVDSPRVDEVQQRMRKKTNKSKKDGGKKKRGKGGRG